LDGTEMLLHVEDTELVFETGWGSYRLPLHRVTRLHNIARVVALREYLWASRFEIFSQDGNKVVGVPKSPRVLYLHEDEGLPERGQIKLCEIDWLIVKGKRQ
jgi:hypothetical protein